MQTTTPQTVSFVAVIDYRSFERMNEGLPEQIKYEFDVFEEMICFSKKKENGGHTKIEQQVAGTE